MEFNHVRNIESVERLQLSILSEEDPSFDKIWQGLCELILHMNACWNGKDEVELFESALFRLWDEEEDHNKGGNIETTVYRGISRSTKP